MKSLPRFFLIVITQTKLHHEKIKAKLLDALNPAFEKMYFSLLILDFLVLICNSV